MLRKGILAAAVGWVIVHHLCFYYGHFGFDDLHYAELAHRLFDGHVDWGNQYSYRIVPLALWGLSYRLFGVHDWASALPGILATIGILILMYVALRREPVWMFATAVAAFFGMKWNLFYSDKIMADSFVSAFVFSSWVLYHTYRSGWARPEKLGIWAAILLFLAFNSKGTLILVAPLFAAYLLFDLFAGRRGFWRPLIATSSLLLSAYFLLSWAAIGSPLARFRAIEGTHYLNPCSYDRLPLAELLDRLSGGFLELLTTSGLLPHAILAVPALIFFWIRRRTTRDLLFYPGTVVISLLSINFMSISLVSYNPVCLDPRHILLFSPIIAICSGYTLDGLLRTFGLERRGIRFYAVIVGLSGLLLYPSIQLSRYSLTLEYVDTKEAFHDLMEQLPRLSVVYGSEAAKNLGNYYRGFEPRGIVFRNLTDLPDCTVPGPDTNRYLIRNWYTDWHAKVDASILDTVGINGGWIRSPSGLTIARIGVEEFRCE